MRLNLGCGSVPEPGYVNVDIWDQPGVDVVCDLDVLPWPFKDGEAAEIRAWDVFEHVADALGFMAECHRILAPGGLLFIHTVHYQSRNAYTDPTHRRFLTEESFDYWVPGTGLHDRYGTAYARGCRFAKERVWLDLPGGGDMNISLRRLLGARRLSERNTAMAGDIYVARTSGFVNLDGTEYKLQQGETTVREGHPLFSGARHMLIPLVVTYDVAPETQEPPEKPPAQKPAAKQDGDSQPAKPAQRKPAP